MHVAVWDRRELGEANREMDEPTTLLPLAFGATRARPAREQRIDGDRGARSQPAVGGIGCDDHAAYLVAARGSQPLVPAGASMKVEIAAAYPGGLHAHQDLACARLWDGHVLEDEIARASGEGR
jgi:hypothetical protein